MSDARADVQRVLDGLLQRGMLVAGLVGRDGLPLVMRTRRPVQEETFSAMAAAMLASSEAALQEVADHKIASVVANGGDFVLGVSGIDASHLLACIAPASTGSEASRKAIDEASSALRKALGG